jgi:alkylation response protein AidB-like acyl-CoA dehydrogenase
MWAKRLMWIVWPAFLAAGVMEMLVFAAFDPQDMQWLGQSVALSRTGVYSLAFFVFWLVCVGAGYLTTLLSLPGSQVNRPASSG